MEVVGIPTSVPDNEHEKTFCKIVDMVGVKINDRGIESYHRIGSQGHAIVKFSHRKDYQQLRKVKKDLSKLNLTKYYKTLWSKIKRLHAMKQIHSYYVSNGTVKVKLEENSQPISITHASDFDKHFPGIDLSHPS